MDGGGAGGSRGLSAGMSTTEPSVLFGSGTGVRGSVPSLGSPTPPPALETPGGDGGKGLTSFFPFWGVEKEEAIEGGGGGGGGGGGRDGGLTEPLGRAPTRPPSSSPFDGADPRDGGSGGEHGEVLPPSASSDVMQVDSSVFLFIRRLGGGAAPPVSVLVVGPFFSSPSVGFPPSVQERRGPSLGGVPCDPAPEAWAESTREGGEGEDEGGGNESGEENGGEIVLRSIGAWEEEVSSTGNESPFGRIAFPSSSGRQSVGSDGLAAPFFHHPSAAVLEGLDRGRGPRRGGVRLKTSPLPLLLRPPCRPPSVVVRAGP